MKEEEEEEEEEEQQQQEEGRRPHSSQRKAHPNKAENVLHHVARSTQESIRIQVLL